MDVRLTDEHRLLVETVDAIAAAHAPTSPSELRAVGGDATPGRRVTGTPGSVSAGDARAAGAEDALAAAGREALDATGLTSLRGPGGSGGSGVDGALVAERLAAHLCPAPFLGPTLAAELGAPPDERATVVVDADLLSLGSTWAIDATGATVGIGVDPDGELTRFELGPPIDAAADLSRHLRPAHPDPNLQSNRGPTTDDSTAGSEPDLNLRSNAAASGRDSTAGSPLLRWTALALSLTTADLVGTMEGAITLAVTHARERQQFGRPVGSFQAVQHLLAEAHVSVEAARSALWHAAWAVDELDPPAALEAARIAKAYASRVGPEVCETAIQVLGGIGMTWESLAHAYLRRARFDAALFGGEVHQLRKLA